MSVPALSTRQAKRRQLIVDAKRYGDHARYYGALERMIRALRRRIVEAGDYADLVLLQGVRDEADQALALAVHDLRARGASWATIGNALGISRQRAEAKWGDQ